METGVAGQTALNANGWTYRILLQELVNGDFLRNLVAVVVRELLLVNLLLDHTQVGLARLFLVVGGADDLGL